MRSLCGTWLRVIAASGFLFFCATAVAAPARTLRFDQLTLEQGLAQETVRAIVQDRAGYMWFGGQGGLSRFDGYRVSTFKHVEANPHGLASDWILSLCADRHGRLWIGTNAGLHLFDPVTEGFTRFVPAEQNGKGKDGLTIKAIADDGKDGLWLATLDGLQHFDPANGRFDVYRHDPGKATSISDNAVYTLARDSRGDLWISTGAGIDRLHAATRAFRHFHVHGIERLQRKRIGEIHIDASDTLWITYKDGIEAWSLEGEEPKQRQLALPAELRKGIRGVPYRDRDGNLWLQSDDGLKLWELDQDRVTSYRNLPNDPHSLAGNDVFSIYQDRSGTLWVGTWTAGVSRVDLASGGFARYVHAPGKPGQLTSNKVISILDAGSQALWLGTHGGGVNLLDLATGTATSYLPRNTGRQGEINQLITDMRYDRTGRLWVGTTDGMFRFDPARRSFTRVEMPARHPQANSVSRILAAKTGELWIATAGGLYRYDRDTGSFQSYLHDAAQPGSISSNDAISAFEDSRGNVWVGTSAGLDRFDPVSGRFDHYFHEANKTGSLSSGQVQVVFEDAKGRLWIGTDAGLSRMDKGADGSVRFRVYETGAPVGGILEDTAGRLWVSTDAGISRFDPADESFQHYTSRDGMIEGGYFSGSAFRGADNTLYFGGIGGLTAFRPEAIRENTAPPAVLITDFQVFNRSLRGGNGPDGMQLARAIEDLEDIVLSYRQSVFSIEFSAAHYADPQRNRFAYQLEGFDKNWTFTDGTRRVATYTNLDPGEYRFRVRASNKNGVWNEEGATLRITITPPFWKTWWFRAGTVLAVLSLLFLAYRARIRRLTRQRAMLEEEVRLRTAEVQQKAAELERAYQSLEQASVTDPLTGLRNRRFLHQHLESDVALCLREYEEFLKRGDNPPDASDIIFLMVDLDHFKAVNDTYGHAAGDQVLVQIRERLQGVSRDSDYIVRWGGEEFLVVARRADRRHAEAMAERIREAIAHTEFELPHGHRLAKTCSIGFACFPFNVTRPLDCAWPDVVEIADHALYLAKRGGRNTWVGMEATGTTPGGDDLRTLIEKPEQAVASGQMRKATPRQPETLPH